MIAFSRTVPKALPEVGAMVPYGGASIGIKETPTCRATNAVNIPYYKASVGHICVLESTPHPDAIPNHHSNPINRGILKGSR